MEWDFLGLNSRNSTRTVEEDAACVSKDSAAERCSRMQWSFSSKGSLVPQLLSFKAPQEDRARKSIVDPLASLGYMTMSTADALDSNNNKSFLGVMHRNMSITRQGGMTVYPMQHLGGHSARPQAQEARIFAVSKQSNQMNRPVLQSSNLVSSDHQMVNSAIKQRPVVGGVELKTPAPVLPSRGLGSIVGTTDLRSSSISSGTPAQMTIFYGGSVRVYHDITPEKAEAIMLMAGNGSISSQNKTVSSAQVQAPICVPSKDDAFIIGQSYPSSLPSPLPGRGSSTNNELTKMTPAASPVTHTNLMESPKPVGSAARKMVPAGLPQIRKASLARFLEKRKERVLSVSPYSMNTKPGSDGVSLSLNSSGCFPLQAI